MVRYLIESKRFVYGVIAVLPLLIFYEIGLWQGTLKETLNGADAIFRLLLRLLTHLAGIRWSNWVLAGAAGVLAVGFLWHLKRSRVRIRLWYIAGMFLEAAIAGIVLAVLVYFILGRQLPEFFTFQPNPGVTRQLARQGLASPWSRVAAAIGAGVFEELLFRVLLLAGFYYLWAKNRGPLGDDQAAAVRAVLLSSVVFTLLHLGSVSVGGLLSVFATSILLSWLYLARGYGVAALAHTAYDLYLMFGVVA